GDQCQGSKIEGVAQVGCFLQGLLRGFTQSPKALGKKRGHVVGYVFAADLVEVPDPASGPVVKAQQVLAGQDLQKLTDEEGVPLCLSDNQFSEGKRLFGVRVQGICDQLVSRRQVQRRQCNRVDLGSLANGVGDGV